MLTRREIGMKVALIQIVVKNDLKKKIKLESSKPSIYDALTA